MSSFSRWLVFTAFLAMAFWNAGRAFHFHPQDSVSNAYWAFLVAIFIAMIVAKRRDRRRRRAQSKVTYEAQ